MSHARRAAMLPAIVCLSLATPAIASPPDPSNCEAPDLITVVARGADGGADPHGTFTVIVRDRNNVPMLNEEVVLDFSGCPDIKLAADQLDPSVSVDCLAHTLGKLSDVNGRATFLVIGSAANLGASPGAIGPALDVYAEGIFVNAVRVAALDQNGGGVSGEDLSLLLTDYFSGQAFARSDYDGSGVLDGNDLSLWLAAFFAGGSAQDGGENCRSPVTPPSRRFAPRR
jgi:hypothetical protein